MSLCRATAPAGELKPESVATHSWPLGWSLLSGGGSINPWETLDQWKKGSGESGSQCSNPECDVVHGWVKGQIYMFKN